MCVKFLEDALGQKLPRRPQSGPGEQLTVFQFWSYFEALDSSSMEAYVTETAEEGEAVALVTKWPDAMGGSEGVNSGHEGIPFIRRWNSPSCASSSLSSRHML